MASSLAISTKRRASASLGKASGPASCLRFDRFRISELGFIAGRAGAEDESALRSMPSWLEATPNRPRQFSGLFEVVAVLEVRPETFGSEEGNNVNARSIWT